LDPQWGEPFSHVSILEKKSFKMFSRTSTPISVELDTNHLCIKGIQVGTNKGLLQRGDNYNNAKIGWGHLKYFFLKNP
jgi:hypothetical protein